MGDEANAPVRLPLAAIWGEALAVLAGDWRPLLPPGALLACVCAAWNLLLLGGALSGAAGGAITALGGVAIGDSPDLVPVILPLAAVLLLPPAALPLMTAAQRAALGATDIPFRRALRRGAGACCRFAVRALFVCLPLVVLTWVDGVFVVFDAFGTVFNRSVGPQLELELGALAVLLAAYGLAAAFLSRYLPVLPAAIGGTGLTLAQAAALGKGQRLRLLTLLAVPILVAFAAQVAALCLDHPPLVPVALVLGGIDGLSAAWWFSALALAYRRIAPCDA